VDPSDLAPSLPAAATLPGGAGDALAGAEAPPVWVRALEPLFVLGVAIYCMAIPRSTAREVAILGAACLVVGLLAARRVIPAAPPRRGGLRPLGLLLGLSAVVVVGALAHGLVYGVIPQRPVFLRTALVYLAYASVQQYLTQRYLVVRLRGWLPGRSDRQVALVTGVVFGVLHLPWPALIVPSAALGTLWGHAYLSSGRWVPVALSHACIAVAFFLFVLGHDPFRAGLGSFGL
jgi:hypothetical protein